MAKFDSKTFNPNVFGKYVEHVPKLKVNELLRSRALVGNPDIKGTFTSQTGTAYGTIPLLGNIDGTALNYDGNTDITATSLKTFEQGVVVTGRAKAWVERDFSYDITGGVDFMGNIANQVSAYWEDIDQDILLAILSGLYDVPTTEQGLATFRSLHTTDICNSETSEAQNVNVTTLNSAIQKACGSNKKKFSLVIMHSQVATNLENLNLLAYLKYTDANGIQRDLSLGTWNGKVVLVDDSMPTVAVQSTAGTAGTYELTIGTALVNGKNIVIDGHTYKCTTAGSGTGEFVAGTAAAEATALAALIGDDLADFTVTASSTKVIFTQIVRGTGDIPTVALEGTGAGAATIAAGTAGVAPTSGYTAYVTYALGEGAFYYEDIGASVPYEMSRDPKTNGGQDTLYSRQRKVFAPAGISYLKASQVSLSPTNAELGDGDNWGLVSDGADIPTYYDHKAIAIAKIVSRG